MTNPINESYYMHPMTTNTVIPEIPYTPAPLTASMLVDPEDRIINASINTRGFFVRCSISRGKNQLIKDWQNILEHRLSGETLLTSLDLKRDKKTNDRMYIGTTVYNLADAVCVVYLSSSDYAFFHFWSDSQVIAEEYCLWIEQNLFQDKIQNVLDEVSNQRELTFWGAGGGDYNAYNRKVSLFNWDENFRSNYPPRVLAHLEALRDLKPPIEGGKIILCHGMPGTGKTSLLRALARVWTKWCHTSYITDPENFLGSSGAMLKVITWDFDSYIDEAIEEANAYHLLIIEDADELISEHAKDKTGQSLSRLLNIGDGLLGHSTNLLICITTNVEMANLNAAVSRAGRCLANIHFDEFTYDEAIKWLKFHTDLTPHQAGLVHGETYSLATLYHKIGKIHQITNPYEEKISQGVYL